MEDGGHTVEGEAGYIEIKEVGPSDTFLIDEGGSVTQIVTLEDLRQNGVGDCRRPEPQQIYTKEVLLRYGLPLLEETDRGVSVRGVDYNFFP
jgi:hypothetical protein